VSGDSGDLATSASAEVGGIVIGITPETTLSQGRKMVRAWSFPRRLLLHSKQPSLQGNCASLLA